MQTYELLVRNRAVFANSDNTSIVRTSIGSDQIHVLFDSDEWLGFDARVTFSNGRTVTMPIAVTEVFGSPWMAEATSVIPHEVTSAVGDIRVTIQGTDANGNHIITAEGAPLTVVEAGDVIDGEAPSETVTDDQWHEVYRQAMQAVADAGAAVNEMRSRIDELAQGALANLPVATREGLGIVQVGDGLNVDEGVLSATMDLSELSTAQSIAIINLSRLARAAFDAEFDESGMLKEGVKIKPSVLADVSSVLPIADEDTLGAIYPDGTTVKVDEDGMLHAVSFSHRWDGSVLTIESISGATSADLRGPEGGKGLKGDQGDKGDKGDKGDSGTIDVVTASIDDTHGNPTVTVTLGGTPSSRSIDFAFTGLMGPQGIQGPSGYVLTDEDVGLISQQIIERYTLADTNRY